MKALWIVVLLLGGRLFAGDKVEEVACSPFVNAMPYSEIVQSARTPNTITELLAIINDPSRRSCWANATRMIGIFGGDTQATFLIDRISQDNGNITQDEWNAKVAALSALGFLANKGSATATNFLEGLVSRWNSKESLFVWKRPEYVKNSKFNLYFAIRAIQALSISGKPETTAFLKKFKRDRNLKYAIADGLRFNQAVQRDGLENVYP